MSPFSLEGKKAIVTGGGTGIGLGVTKALIEAGAKVLITGRKEEKLKKVSDDLGESCVYFSGDMTDAKDRAQLVSQAESLLGGSIDFLVNNAGNHLKKAAADVSDEEFQNVMSIHVNASFALSRDFYPSMLKSGGGSIVMIASMASYMGVPKIVAYTAAKCAVVGLTRSLAAEWSANNIRVNAIAPGWISTPMTDKAFAGDPQRMDKVLGRTPMNKFGKPDDIGQAVVYLCSPAAKFVTGTLFPVDGGAQIGF